jgi:hypothetical protein
MIAVGAMKRQADTTLGKLSGPSVLGTDLSDDHPISFVYDQALVGRRRSLAGGSRGLAEQQRQGGSEVADRSRRLVSLSAGEFRAGREGSRSPARGGGGAGRDRGGLMGKIPEGALDFYFITNRKLSKVLRSFS